MSKIVFFSIPAYGHTNPTVEVVRELVDRGNEVLYYSFNEFKDKIEGAGAKFICCDKYLPELHPGDEKKIGKDFSGLIEMIVDTTISLDEKVCIELKDFNPDCIVSDSLSFWGKLFAQKLNIPYICSTTTFAINKHTAKMMKQSFMEIIRMVFGMRRINKKIKLLQKKGYDVKNFISIVSNDDDTNTIVYTSKEFQPMVETFSSKYSFVGPSVSNVIVEPQNRKKKLIYISLGTINNKNIKFYKNCINAFKDFDVDVIMSVGRNTDIKSLGHIPNNFEVKNSVKQIAILQETDVFITHCGMNSVNESLYYGVPMVLFPQHSEQRMVANRVTCLGVGLMLKENKSEDIKCVVFQVMNDKEYKENAIKLSESFYNAGGSKKAADVILQVIKQYC
ncbi:MULTISPECIES: macrolide family glycosyltransferase [unclassified Clostridioides]|uniref:macrolide family glycosyltransferase n=1 Tax=unclassified Clostridioides TaxID=2635829 RepID=UPI001D127038|nr:glucosyltransferase [Clostridioides sp. ZZV14-6150]MCC0724352.1 glucosyltransferase [Clostridioides sp. ZZV14-6104]MCC0728421.1 glucosyltransferase [Clostridioides sp. ZZV14-6045]MCC0732680.1 glucosyltransferase [Clostridioides sp. ZZV14-6048]MCC0736646.1 glucosyltransferase [Clostridioides sp. ZZV14-6009]MCC0739460.1 glucosyltransferase [Clostridioides sp. ZZV14-5902]MCC0744673.1 glucosyltransferase [Clostridioides sp. ZZV14-6044]MCC0750439.1 glucosyltransferase [Clostridioides sp. ZZV13